MSPSRHPKIWSLGLSVALAGAAGAQAAPLECPRAQEGGVSAALTAADAEILKSEDRGDLAVEINEIVNRLQLQWPALSYAEIVNALIAAYCPVVAGQPDLTDAQRQARVERFAGLAQRLAPEDSLPAGSQIIASVPLPPDVYRRLGAEAAAHNLTTAQFLAKMLTRAAGQ
jgi:hypothetical protein